MLVNLRNSRPALVVFGLAGAAALLVVVTANVLADGVWIFPLLAGVLAFLALRRVGPSLLAALGSILLIFPALAIVVFGVYFVDSLVR